MCGYVGGGSRVIRILVAATSEIVRAGLEALLAANPALTVLSSVPDLAALAQQVEGVQPDVLVLEVELHDEDTTAALLALAAEVHPPAVVVLTDDPLGAWTAEALRSGVRAILPRQAVAGEIVAAVEATAAGLVALHPDAVEALLPAASLATRTLPGSPQQQALSPREIEVLGMMAEGLGNKEIAWRLGLSEHTVKFHVSAIFAKLNATSRTEAVTLGFRQGLILL
jgi:two-component system, NarL family, response regulator YdfI